MEDFIILDEKDIGENKLKKENVFLLFSSLLLGVLFNVLFYDKPFGVSYPIFIFVFYGILVLNARREIKFNLNFGWILGLAILVLALTFFVFSNEIFRFFNFMGIPILIVGQTLLITGNDKNKWHSISFIGDLVEGIFVRTFSNIPKPFEYLSNIINKRTDPKKYVTVKKILIGLIISIPMLMVIIYLLSSADEVFGNLLNKIPNLFIGVSIGDFIARILIAAVITIFSFAYLWSLINQKTQKEGNAIEIEKTGKRILDPIIVITILICINFIYLIFTTIQFSYLFGGIVPSGLTYSEYARKGFFELVAVTLINFSIILSLINFTRKGSKLINRFVQVLCSLIIVCTFIMLYSAHYRMSMYENEYGYTYLRMFTHTFMAFLFILFVIALYRIWNEKISLLKPYIVVSLVSFMIINYMNVDVIIAKNNINRFDKTGKIDVSYLTCLSNDAIPQISKLLNNKNKEVATQVENYLYSRKKTLSENNFWQSFNIADYKARSELSKYDLHYSGERVLKYREID